MSRRLGAALLAAAVVAATLAGGASPALASASSASSDDDGLWYYDLFSLEAAHDAGFTGEGVTIAVLDTAINPDAPALSGADVQVQPSLCFDESGTRLSSVSTGADALHATRVVSLIVGDKGVAPDATVLVYNNHGPENADGFAGCLGPEGKDEFSADGAAVLLAVKAGADIISVSAGLSATPELITALAIAQSKGVVILGAVANNDESEVAFSPELPANSNGVVGIQSIDVNGATLRTDGSQKTDADADVLAPGVRVLIPATESGGEVDWSGSALGTGTSFATPIVAGMLALVKQKYPDATGNQLIQTLIRNTGANDHELIYDANYVTGYGVASATHMLKVDPTQYEDTNPLLIDGPNFLPTKQMVENPDSLDDWLDALYGTTAETPAETPASADPSDAPADSGLPIALLLVLLGVGALVVIGVIILIIVLASRRSRNGASS